MYTVVSSPGSRTGWVDYARGICIVMVVAFYATGYVQEAAGRTGWMDYVTTFARPFRMPDFFLISGLFVSHVLGRPWRSYLDTKVVHFFYFYILWVTIKFVLVSGQAIGSQPAGLVLADYLSVYVQPHGPLWFIYILPFFFLAVRLSRSLPVWLVFSAAVALKLIDLDTGWKLMDRFGMYFIFFYSGHLFSTYILRLAGWAQNHVRASVAVLIAWAAVNSAVVSSEAANSSLGHLVAGYFGSMAVILVSSLLVRVRWMKWLRYLGENAIVVYLGFVIPLFLMRLVIESFTAIMDIGTVCFAITVFSVLGSLMLYWSVRNTPLRFLFERPQWAKIYPGSRSSAGAPVTPAVAAPTTKRSVEK